MASSSSSFEEEKFDVVCVVVVLGGGKVFESPLCEDDSKGEQKHRLVRCDERSLSDDADKIDDERRERRG